ncbi:N-formylglutamate amidohydrolase [Euzebya tangerina]|uniref:N-formylglutamate amidohydrolase n=1 Tax=Euzebya tangerina TaxID=591198 RepID=UPI000E3141BC|nr:N-formylglutamate amidohydrolase [Euzebya tangerina]
MRPPSPIALDQRWEIRRGNGPVLATALHAGHDLRPELAALSALDAATRLREEDPLTDVLASVGDHLFVPAASRFEVDLNRPADEAVYLNGYYAWGLEPWSRQLEEAEVARSLAARERYYQLMRVWLEELITTYGAVLVLDVHSFNHRPADGDGEPGPPTDHPDIDLGLTTADEDRFGELVETLWTELTRTRMPAAGDADRAVEVDRNARFVDGGHWPEWVFEQYGEHVCTVTLEYKKVFMDEWAGTADIQALHALHSGLRRAVDAVRHLVR